MKSSFTTASVILITGHQPQGYSTISDFIEIDWICESKTDEYNATRTVNIV